MVAWCAACSRWYWANAHQATHIGSSTSSAATGPYGLRHRTAIMSPASPWTAIGPSDRVNNPRQARRAGTRSASSRMPPSSRVSTRQNASTAAPAGTRA